MEKFLGPILQGIPTAIGAVIIIILFVNPIDRKVERVMSVMNRELIPLINELKEGGTQRLPVQPIPTAQLKELEKGIAELKSEIQNTRASINDVKQFSLVVSSLGPASVASLKELKAGDIIHLEGVGYPALSGYNLKVTDPRPLNKIQGEVFDAMKKSGLQVIKIPEKK